MTKKEINIRKKAYEMFKDNPDYYRIDGAIKVFDLDKAKDGYIQYQQDKKTKKKINKDNGSPDNIIDLLFSDTNVEIKKEKYNYDISQVLNENLSVIDYDKLEKEWISWTATARKYRHKKKIDCSFLHIWLDSYIESNKIAIKQKHIEYGPGHYAIRNDKTVDDTGLILNVNDFLIHDKNNKIIKYNYKYFRDSSTEDERNGRTGNSANRIIDVIHIYTSLFWHMGIKDESLMYVHVLWMMLKTCDLKTWFFQDSRDTVKEDGTVIYSKDKQIHNYFSPITLRDIIVKHLERSYKPVPKPGCSKRHKFQKMFIEPGYEEQAREAYKRDKRAVIAGKIIAAAKHLRNLGEVVNEATVFTETNRMTTVNKRKFREIEKEFDIDIERVVKKQDTSKRKKQDTSVRKHHKQQERSEWHEMVRAGATYHEIIEKYPEVSKVAYRVTKSRINNGM